jgi:hypothetical protein
MINATATEAAGVCAFFGLQSISIKPLTLPIDPDPVIANLTIRGWPADEEGTKRPLLFQVQWTPGYTEPLLIDFESRQFTPYRWKALGLLDIAVEFGPDRLDWEFCLDDLKIGLAECGPDNLHGELEHEGL